MRNFSKIVETVRRNCDVSDARHAGEYSLCVFLLKMREYYRWENEIPLTSRLPRGEVGDWMAQRERSWESLGDADYAQIPIDDSRIDPFDADAVNATLVPAGYVYSSGVGLFGKPHFFLGRLSQYERYDSGSQVLVSSCEYARDLVAPPAMMRNNTIFVSRESVRRFVWERIEEWQFNRENGEPMARALACYGKRPNMERVLDDMSENETETMILHELGEVMAGEFLGKDWEKMLAALPRSGAAIVARAVRDHLADCLTTLPSMLVDDNEPSLHFYFANLTGMRKKLFPEALVAYERWADSRDRRHLRELCCRGRDRWRQKAESLLHTYREHGEAALPGIEAACAQPLGD